MDVPLPASRARAIRRRLLAHYDRHRRDLPWRGEPDPYRIWISEVILQQTRVETAIPYYRRWLERFPTLETLAAADPEEVMAVWSGLGYYRRARNLHRAARIVRDRLSGRLPADAVALETLPGIGPYTAGAVASIAFGRRVPAVDGNARRVLARLFDLVDPAPAELAALAGALVPGDRPGDFNQALMELGATVCRPRRPACGRCPVEGVCLARSRGTAADRPRRAGGRPLPEAVVGTAVVLCGEGRVLLARRADEGLLGGTWEFPGAIVETGEATLSAARRAARALLGRRAPRKPVHPSAFTTVPHAFSHRRHVYHGFLFRVGDEAAADPDGHRTAPVWSAARWVALPTLGRRALPAAQRRIAAALDQLRSAPSSSRDGSSRVR